MAWADWKLQIINLNIYGSFIGIDDMPDGGQYTFLYKIKNHAEIEQILYVQIDVHITINVVNQDIWKFLLSWMVANSQYAAGKIVLVANHCTCM